jgi:hypothetical protein
MNSRISVYSLEYLNKLAHAVAMIKSPNLAFDYPSSLYTKKLKASNTNSLTECIIRLITFSGYHAERINIVGIVRKEGGYRASSMQKGTADVSATIKGLSVKIEVKFGKDRQSEHQKIYQGQITASGGIYYIAQTYEDFARWYSSKFEIDLNHVYNNLIEHGHNAIRAVIAKRASDAANDQTYANS